MWALRSTGQAGAHGLCPGRRPLGAPRTSWDPAWPLTGLGGRLTRAGSPSDPPALPQTGGGRCVDVEHPADLLGNFEKLPPDSLATPQHRCRGPSDFFHCPRRPGIPALPGGGARHSLPAKGLLTRHTQATPCLWPPLTTGQPPLSLPTGSPSNQGPPTVCRGWLPQVRQRLGQEGCLLSFSRGPPNTAEGAGVGGAGHTRTLLPVPSPSVPTLSPPLTLVHVFRDLRCPMTPSLAPCGYSN